MGSAKAAVFPDPVSARPMISFPMTSSQYNIVSTSGHTFESDRKALSLNGCGSCPVEGRARLAQNLRHPLR